MAPPAARVHLQQALAVYVESLASGAPVALFGDASSGVAERLVEAGARNVHVYDPDPARARQAGMSEAIRIQPYLGRDPAARRAGLVLVPDLGLFDDPAEVLAFARVLAGDDGVAVVGGANRETAASPRAPGFDYYELFELVAAEFPSVRMVAQLDFRGVALVALGDSDDEPAVSVDTQLVEGDRPVTSFVALGASREIAVDPYAIVELPSEGVTAVAPSEERRILELAPGDIALAIERRAAEAVRALEERSDQLRTELKAALDRQRVLERELHETVRRAADLELASRDREPAIGALREHAADLEAAVAISARRLAEVIAELEHERAEGEAVRRAAAQAAAQIEVLGRRALRAEHRVEQLEGELATSGDTHAGELLRFEEALRERGQALRELERELSGRERIVHELLASLDEDGAAPGGPAPPAAAPDSPHAREENARLRRQLDGLALELARREGDIQAAAWTVAELERKLAERDGAVAAPSAATRAPGAVPTTGAHPAASDRGSGEVGDSGATTALDEVDALRRALTQEHAARVRAESGEALRQAQAEIAQLTVLLEQVAADRAARAGAAANPTAGPP